jgi:hypothetical protein
VVLHVTKRLNIKDNPSTDSMAANTKKTKPITWPTILKTNTEHKDAFIIIANVAHSNNINCLNIEL